MGLANDDTTVSLMKAAHKYQVATLVDICIDTLSSGLTDEVAVKRLMLADLIGSEPLQRKCLAFITSSSERIANIQESETFKDLAKVRPHLLVDILAAAFPPAKRRRLIRPGTNGSPVTARAAPPM